MTQMVGVAPQAADNAVAIISETIRSHINRLTLSFASTLARVLESERTKKHVESRNENTDGWACA